jgi:citrate synthase
MGRITFSQGIWLALTGELPSAELGTLLDAMLLASIDHGVTPPSALAAIQSASTGAPINAAIASGVLAINRHHGGAIENCMKTLLKGLDLVNKDGKDTAQAANQVVSEARAAKVRLAGFGHRIHTDDPRTPRIFELAEKAGIDMTPVELIQNIADELEKQSGRKLPINVDGAIAAILVSLNVDPKMSNAFFIMARVPGMVAHIEEEWKRQKPMRRIHPTEHSYDGPEDRDL